jgi:hypothetical protein
MPVGTGAELEDGVATTTVVELEGAGAASFRGRPQEAAKRRIVTVFVAVIRGADW